MQEMLVETLYAHAQTNAHTGLKQEINYSNQWIKMLVAKGKAIGVQWDFQWKILTYDQIKSKCLICMDTVTMHPHALRKKVSLQKYLFTNI